MTTLCIRQTSRNWRVFYQVGRIINLNTEKMRELIRNIFNSLQCEISILLILCCMIVTTISFKSGGEWNDIAVASSILGGFLLLGLLIWITVKLIARKEVRAMSDRPRIVIESISRLMFLYWIYITMSLIFAIIWAAFVVWDGIRSVRQITY